MHRNATLSEFGSQTGPDLDALTDAEKRAFVATRLNGAGVREFARETGRSPGTVSNLLRRADEKLGGGR